MRKIEISPAYCAMICMIAWADISIAICFFIAVVVHEMGHLAAAFLCKVGVESIRFRICGAVIQAKSMNYRQEIIVASAGPAVSLLTAYLFHKVNATYFIISALLAATNLLPIYPLDGGRILKSALMMRISPTLVQLIMKVVSFLVCSALMLAACWYAAVCQTGIWPIFAVLIVLIRFWESTCTEFGIQNHSCFSSRKKIQ